MTRRLAILLAVAALVASACSDVPHAEFEPPQGFVPFVADSNDNVGLGNDIAVTSDGVPYVSYFGFEAQLDADEIAAARPVWAPFIPAVQVASVADDGAWTLGAVAQSREFSNVPVPFGPSLVESLKSLEPDNANGTSIAVGENGTRHVAWASNNGIWYASSAESSTAEQIASLGTTLNMAGPIGRPGIAVAGNIPWIAWTVNVAGGQEVRVATAQRKGWRQETIASIPCTSCPVPLPTEVGVTSSGPLVVFVDQSAGAVRAMRAAGALWAPELVADGVAGLGVSLDVTEDVARVSYYTGDGTVELAEGEGTSWSTVEVGASGQIQPGRGNFAPTTGLAADSEGNVNVAWYDAGSDSVKLAREAEGVFEEVPTVGTEGGRYPSLAAGAEGRVYLAWYDVTTEDLLVGVLDRFENLLVAQPSPTPAIAPPLPTETCEPDGTDFQITAQGTAFDSRCLAVQPGESFTVALDNQDAFAHNFSIYADDSFSPDAAIETTPLDTTVVSRTETYDFKPIEDPGDYFFQCDFHPIPAMRGSFIVAGGGGGGQ